MIDLTHVDHMFRRFVLRPRNVFFAELLWPSLVRLVLLEFCALAHRALFLFDRQRPEPVAHLIERPEHQRSRIHREETDKTRHKHAEEPTEEKEGW
jgi:hypothetical protein